MSDERHPKPKRPPSLPAPPPKPAETVSGASEPVASASAPQRPATPAEMVMAAQQAAAALPEPPPKADPPPPKPAPQRGAERGFGGYRVALASMAESQTAIAADVAEIALEMTEMTHANLKAAGDGLSAFLKARSLVDAVEAQLGFARRSLDAMVNGSTRLGELGLRLAGDATKPILRPFAG